MITNLKQLYHDQLCELYGIESRLVAALPEFSRHATHEPLKREFNRHLGETRKQRAPAGRPKQPARQAR